MHKCTWNGCSGCANCAAATASPPPPPACDNYPEASSPSHVDTYYKGADTPFDFAELNTPPGATFEDKLQACKDKCDADSWSDPTRFTGKCVGVGYAADANHAGMSFCYGVMDPPYHQDADMEHAPNWVLLDVPHTEGVQ